MKTFYRVNIIASLSLTTNIQADSPEEASRAGMCELKSHGEVSNIFSDVYELSDEDDKDGG